MEANIRSTLQRFRFFVAVAHLCSHQTELQTTSSLLKAGPRTRGAREGEAQAARREGGEVEILFCLSWISLDSGFKKYWDLLKTPWVLKSAMFCFERMFNRCSARKA